MQVSSNERTPTDETTEGPIYTSRLIKASALLQDTKALLHFWDPTLSVARNLQRVRDENLLASPSRSRLDDILAIFRRRYLRDEAAGSALAILVKEKLPAAG